MTTQDQELLGFIVLARDIHGEYDMPLGLGLLFLPDDRESADVSAEPEGYFVAEVRKMRERRRR